jgi:hypothetical protein
MAPLVNWLQIWETGLKDIRFLRKNVFGFKRMKVAIDFLKPLSADLQLNYGPNFSRLPSIIP